MGSVKVHLVDGTYELFRQNFGRLAKEPDAGPFAATTGVLASTLQLLADGATHVAVASDHVIESFRNNLWRGYKTSAGMPPELLAQIPIVEQALEAMGVTTWAMVELRGRRRPRRGRRDRRRRRARRAGPDRHPGQGPRPVRARHAGRAVRPPQAGAHRRGRRDRQVRRSRRRRSPTTSGSSATPPTASPASSAGAPRARPPSWPATDTSRTSPGPPGSGTSPVCAVRPSCPPPCAPISSWRCCSAASRPSRRTSTSARSTTGTGRGRRRSSPTSPHGSANRHSPGAPPRSPTAADARPHRGRCHPRPLPVVQCGAWRRRSNGLLVLDLSGNVSGGVRGPSCSPTSAPRVVMVEPRGRQPAAPAPAVRLPRRRQGVASSRPTTSDMSRLAGRRRRRAHRRHVAVARRGHRRPARPRGASSTSPRSGAAGPYADWATSDLVTWAMGGYLYFTGSPDREPIWLPGPHAQLHAAAHAALADARRAPRARAQRARAGASRSPSSTPRSPPTPGWCRRGPAAVQLLGRVPPDLIRAKDGWVYVMRIVPKDELFVMIERPDLMDRGFTVDIPTWNATIPRDLRGGPGVGERQDGRRDRRARPAAARRRDAGASTARDVLADEQLAARDWWEREGDTAFPGQPYKLTATPSARARPGAGDRAHARRPAGAAPTVAATAVRRRLRRARSRASASSR